MKQIAENSLFEIPPKIKIMLWLSIVLGASTFIVCFDGSPIVNNKSLKRYEFSRLNLNKSYEINLNDGALGIFYKT